MQRHLAIAAAAIAVAGSGAAHAEKGDLIVRARAIMVAPTEKSGPVQPGFPGGRVAVGNSVAPELDFTYMLTDRLGTELILGTTRHAISGRGSLDGLGRIARTWVLPPTLTLQYHFAPQARVRPYVGAGLNHTIFYADKASAALEAAIGRTAVRLKDSTGYAVQAGIDVDLTPKLFVNFDVKYIDIDTTARLTTGAAVNRVAVSLDPVVVGIGVGTRF